MAILNENNFRNYQHFGRDHIINTPKCGLLMGMGLGKTVVTLTAINRLMYEYFEVSRALIIAPKKVSESVWPGEICKWDHVKHLRIVNVNGTEKQRIKALKETADIYVISRDNTAWICGYYSSRLPFEMLVIDESSSFKNNNSMRFKAIRFAAPQMKRIVILTGTPAPNSLLDLWPQIYLLDGGQRLEKFITRFRDKYLKPNKRNQDTIYNYKPRSEKAEQEIYDKIKDICISMKSEDYLDLPGVIVNEVIVKLDAKTQAKYDEFEREQILELANLEEITAFNSAALRVKLLQFANGAVYDADRNVHFIHDHKIEACRELIEAAQGQPVLIAWTYKHDRDRIHEAFKNYKIKELKDNDSIEAWNRGEIDILTTHPASGGHGLNLQEGGHIIIWFGQTDSLELYLQLNARLPRPGQKHRVIIHKLIAVNTFDQDVVKGQANKNKMQESLLNAIKAKIKKYKNV